MRPVCLRQILEYLSWLEHLFQYVFTMAFSSRSQEEVVAIIKACAKYKVCSVHRILVGRNCLHASIKYYVLCWMMELDRVWIIPRVLICGCLLRSDPCNTLCRWNITWRTHYDPQQRSKHKYEFNEGIHELRTCGFGQLYHPWNSCFWK